MIQDHPDIRLPDLTAGLCQHLLIHVGIRFGYLYFEIFTTDTIPIYKLLHLFD